MILSKAFRQVQERLWGCEPFSLGKNNTLSMALLFFFCLMEDFVGLGVFHLLKAQKAN